MVLLPHRPRMALLHQDFTHWDITEPLPSYGRGIDLQGWRYRSLINGDYLHDVVITRGGSRISKEYLVEILPWAAAYTALGMHPPQVITGGNGTFEGQGSVWWEKFSSHSLNFSRPHLVEFARYDNVAVSNLTFLNSPAWNIHPIYCRYGRVQNITVHASPASPYTSGIVPDSSEYVCIENRNITMGHDVIVLKSGWDEYGIACGKPTKHVHIWDVNLQSSSGSGLEFGSEMSGGILSVLVEQLHLSNSFTGIALKTARGRGGYMKDSIISNVQMENINVAIQVTGQSGSS